MRQRQYLTEDLTQIQRYFPGAEALRLRTPFDLTPTPRRIAIDTFRDTPPVRGWKGKLRWTA